MLVREGMKPQTLKGRRALNTLKDFGILEKWYNENQYGKLLR